MANLVGDTLQEALAHGQGTERPFRCHVHEDTSPSASVNVLKGLWVCYACGASGSVDDKVAPKPEDLEAMLQPERRARVYPLAYNDLFVQPGPIYWHTRLSPWVVHQLGMGEDPVNGFATFPVHLEDGRFAGVGRRDPDPGAEQRFLYPSGWSASRSVFGAWGRYHPWEVLTLVEGASDAAAVQETGCPGLAVYGSGVKKPQIEQIARFSPKLIMLGFDMDTAGEKAVTAAFSQLSRISSLIRVRWPEKDANAVPLGLRRDVLFRTVSASGYRGDVARMWNKRVVDGKVDHESYLEEMSA